MRDTKKLFQSRLVDDELALDDLIVLCRCAFPILEPVIESSC
jgi:hypothetical protein